MICNCCNKNKEEEYFSQDFDKRQNSKDKSKFFILTCDECNDVNEVLKNSPEYEFSKYGLTSLDYRKLLSKQNNKCAICDKHILSLKRRLAVDHCHYTDKIRGLLCQNCNLMLGLARDLKIILGNAIKYLENPPANL